MQCLRCLFGGSGMSSVDTKKNINAIFAMCVRWEGNIQRGYSNACPTRARSQSGRTDSFIRWQQTLQQKYFDITSEKNLFWYY